MHTEYAPGGFKPLFSPPDSIDIFRDGDTHPGEHQTVLNAQLLDMNSTPNCVRVDGNASLDRQTIERKMG